MCNNGGQKNNVYCLPCFKKPEKKLSFASPKNLFTHLQSICHKKKIYQLEIELICLDNSLLCDEEPSDLNEYGALKYCNCKETTSNHKMIVFNGRRYPCCLIKNKYYLQDDFVLI